MYVDGFETFYKKHVLNEDRKVALVTNTSLDIVNKVKSSINISEYFNTVITSTDVSNPKPSPVPYLMAMEMLGVDPEDAIIIEDSNSGLVSGVRSGATVFGIQTTLSTSEISSISSKIIIIKDYSELSKYLDSIV